MTTRQLSDGNDDGTVLGQDAADKIAFYGATPVAQQATITDPTGGATVDTQSRTAINALIDRLQALGLIA